VSLAVRLTGPLVSLRSPVGVAIGLFRLSYRPACLASPTVAIGEVLIEAVMTTSIASSEDGMREVSPGVGVTPRRTSGSRPMRGTRSG
jgi:hypothetical protein